SENDLRIIRRMAALVSAGVPAAEAANVARSDATQVPEREAAAARHPLVDEIVRGATAYDEGAIVTAVRSAQAEQGWAAALDEVVFPALRSIGQNWVDDVVVSANEHFATEVIRRELCAAISELSDRLLSRSPTVLLACPEDERHDVGLLGISLLILERGGRVIYLGADVPITDLARAVSDTRPDAVCISATLPVSVPSLRRSLRTLLSLPGTVHLFAGGPAMTSAGHDIPAVLLPASLTAAADALIKA
ncbi:MAG TPA: cobalamin-dependent protein, partial [Dehalococcoidia bacterium]|nr:cobalamin-dependent protein [Dehalococcoidia bacterium]